MGEQSRQTDPSWVSVKAVDYNPAAREPFDGLPFSALPAWLQTAIRTGRVSPHSRGGTDYAQWTVATAAGSVNAWPGDFISREPDGSLVVTRHPSNRRENSHG